MWGHIAILETPASQSGVVKLSNEDDFRNYYRTFEMTTLEPKVKQQVSYFPPFL